MQYTIILKSKLLMIITLSFAICFATIYASPYLKTEPAYGQESDRIHVSIGSGNNIDSCGPADSPCRTLQFAINKANSGYEILVAGGTYTYDENSNACSNDLGATAVVCILNKALTLKGGYSDDDWYHQNIPTTIDGENIHRGVLAIDTAFSAGLNMDGFTIQNGVARGISARSGDNAIFAYGGGMFVERVEKVALSNIIFKDNRSWGNDTDTAYGGSAFGGGLALRGFEARTVTAVLDNVTFDNNKAIGGTGAERGGQGHGGGIYGTYATVSGSQIEFYNNSARGGDTSGEGETSDGIRADALGAGASFQDGTELDLRNVIAHDNRAIGGNGSQYAGGAFGAGISIHSSNAVFTDMTLRRNMAQGGQGFHGGIGRGGGAEFRDSAVDITNLIAIQNQAAGGDGTTGDRGTAAGGGLSMVFYGGEESPQSAITNGVIAGNAVTLGEGVQTNSSDVEANAVGGAGLLIQAAQVRLEHMTIADNFLRSEGMNGSGLLLAEVDQPEVDVSLTSCIVANHTNYAVYVHPSNKLTLGTCLWSNNSNNMNEPLYAGLEGNPYFVDVPSYDYRIMLSSEAIDQAGGSTVTYDLVGNIRYGTADLGAYEASVPSPFTPVPTRTPTATDVVERTATPTDMVDSTATLVATSTIVPTVTPTFSPGTPIPTPTGPTPTGPTPTGPTPTGPISADLYEVDNTCTFARLLEIDAIAQTHTLHQADDEDWLNFDLEEGASYRVVATRSDPDVQLRIDIYEACEQRLDLPEVVDNSAGVELTFEASDSGRYYARIWSPDENFSGDPVGYELSISEVEPRIVKEGDLAIIITGHDDKFSLQQNIFRAANIAYRTFHDAGIPKNRIRYLGLEGDERGDADHDERSDVKIEATVKNVQETITQWAVERVNSESRVFIYMMDHGLEDFLKLNGDEDKLWADDLDRWLNLLEGTGASIAVIYEACLSGSFITGEKSISKEGRLVITSTDDKSNAFPHLNGGAHFSDAFFFALRQGKSFQIAFDIASDASLKTQSEQKPMLDGNGDGRHDREDRRSACAWKLSEVSDSVCEPISTPIYFTLRQPDQIVRSQEAIQVRYHGNIPINTIWADVYRPDFTPPLVTTDGTMPNLDTDRVEFTGPDGDGIYVGEYDQFDMVGTYRFMIYGVDSGSDTLISEAATVTVSSLPTSHMMYLPAIRR